MNEPQPQKDAIADQLVWSVLSRLAEDKRVRRKLPGEGRIHLDRRLPFLCVFRRRANSRDPFAEQLMTSETAYLVGSAETRHHKHMTGIVEPLAVTLAKHFGSYLIVEIWSDETLLEQRAGEEEPVLRFEISVPSSHLPRKTVETLSKSLRKIKIFNRQAEVVINDRGRGHPPWAKPLIPLADAKHMRCYIVGLAVRPIYLDPRTGELYPSVLRAVRRGLSRVLKQTFFSFASNRTNITPEHYYTFGRRTVVKAVWEVDKLLAAVDDSFDLLLAATPVNAEAAWREFRRHRFDTPPEFHYRPLAVEPSLLKRQLYTIPIERVDDPTLAFLFRQKQDELDRKITLLADINSSRFLPESLQIYGKVPPSLLKLAEEMLERIPTRLGGETRGGQLDAEQFAELARQEIAYYQQQFPDFAATVSVREDMYAGMLVSQGRLLIGGKTKVPRRRANALLQHEIGTHLVTYFNGRAQPFRQLDIGLAGYDGLQEGLAVLSEYLVGGLSRARLRLLAARVVAAQYLIDGASFVETFRALDRTYEFSQRTAYTITMRVYRGGGLTKDMVYLQGLVQILDYLQSGGDIEPLLVGKIAKEHIPLIGELRHRQVLRAPPLEPRYLRDPQVAEKLAMLRNGLTVLQLVEENS